MYKNSATATYESIGSNGYGYSNSPDFSFTFSIILVILTVILTFVVFFALVKSEKKPKGRFTNWLKEFLNFRKILLENILKFIYLLISIGLVLIPLSMIQDTETFLYYIMLVIFGNISLRLTAEFLLMMIMIWKNTSDLQIDVRTIMNIKEDDTPNVTKEESKLRENIAFHEETVRSNESSTSSMDLPKSNF